MKTTPPDLFLSPSDPFPRHYMSERGHKAVVLAHYDGAYYGFVDVCGDRLPSGWLATGTILPPKNDLNYRDDDGLLNDGPDLVRKLSELGSEASRIAQVICRQPTAEAVKLLQHHLGWTELSSIMLFEELEKWTA